MGEKLVDASGYNLYFAGRLIKRGSSALGSDYNLVATDRLGSVRAALENGLPVTSTYLPYGEELSSTGNDVIKFGTYTRDSSTGLDYADQRYYTSQFGRFMSADRFKAASTSDSGSWNKYSYTRGDPANRFDSSGRFDCGPDDPSCDPCDNDPNVRGVHSDYCGAGGGGGDPAPQPPPPSPGPSPAQACKDAGCLSQALKLAEQYLTKQNCQNLFGTTQTRAGAYNPTVTIQQVYSLSGGQVNGVSVGVSFAFWPTLLGDAAVTSGTHVTIGTNTWFETSQWNQAAAVGDVSAMAVLLLHELGHVYNDLSGSGGSAIKNDLGSSQRNDDNNAAIWQNCVRN